MTVFTCHHYITVFRFKLINIAKKCLFAIFSKTYDIWTRVFVSHGQFISNSIKNSFHSLVIRRSPSESSSLGSNPKAGQFQIYFFFSFHCLLRVNVHIQEVPGSNPEVAHCATGIELAIGLFSRFAMCPSWVRTGDLDVWESHAVGNEKKIREKNKIDYLAEHNEYWNILSML